MDRERIKEFMEKTSFPTGGAALRGGLLGGVQGASLTPEEADELRRYYGLESAGGLKTRAALRGAVGGVGGAMAAKSLVGMKEKDLAKKLAPHVSGKLTPSDPMKRVIKGSGPAAEKSLKAAKSLKKLKSVKGPAAIAGGLLGAYLMGKKYSRSGLAKARRDKDYNRDRRGYERERELEEALHRKKIEELRNQRQIGPGSALVKHSSADAEMIGSIVSTFIPTILGIAGMPLAALPAGAGAVAGAMKGPYTDERSEELADKKTWSNLIPGVGPYRAVRRLLTEKGEDEDLNPTELAIAKLKAMEKTSSTKKRILERAIGGSRI